MEMDYVNETLNFDLFIKKSCSLPECVLFQGDSIRLYAVCKQLRGHCTCKCNLFCSCKPLWRTKGYRRSNPIRTTISGDEKYFRISKFE